MKRIFLPEKMMCSRVSEAEVSRVSGNDFVPDEIPDEQESYYQREQSAGERKENASFENLGC
jgi:hypothetical protein